MSRGFSADFHEIELADPFEMEMDLDDPRWSAAIEALGDVDNNQDILDAKAHASYHLADRALAAAE